MGIQLRTSTRPAAPSRADLVNDAQRWIDLGFQPVPMRGKHVPAGDTPATRYTAADFAGATGLQLRTGRQDSGYHLVAVDIDQHKPWQDATSERAAIVQALGLFADSVQWVPTPNNGWHGVFVSPVAVASQTIYDADGRVAGELISTGGGQRCRAPQLPPALLGKEPRERLLMALNLRGKATPSGDSVTDRAADIRRGLSLVRGWERVNVPTVESFLEAGTRHTSPKVQSVATALLDGYRTAGSDRSRWQANFVQHAMLRARELGQTNAERYQRAMKLAVAGNALGKGSERDYKIIEDSAALIYRISIGAPRKDDGHFIAPGWCQTTTDAPQTTQEAVAPPPAPRPPHRPIGDRSTALARFKRLLASLAVDDIVSGYTVAYFAEALQVSRKSVQNYLHDLKAAGDIAYGQANGNGRLVIIIKCRNGGANKSAATPQTTPKTAKVWGASETATESIPTPQTGESAANGIRKKDHQNLTPHPDAPPPAVAAALDADDVSPASPGASSMPGGPGGSDAVGVQGSGDPCSAPAPAPVEQTRPAKRTPPGLQRHEWSYRREVEIQRNTAAYVPTEADQRRSAARAPRLLAPMGDLSELAALLDLRADPPPVRLSPAEQLAALGWAIEHIGPAGYVAAHPAHGRTMPRPTPWHALQAVLARQEALYAPNA